MSIANFAKTVSSTALAVDGDRLTLANPPAPYQLPHEDGGYVVLLSQANTQGGCTATGAEIIRYSGYEADMRTLIITERGVGDTDALDWGIGALVTQPLLGEYISRESEGYTIPMAGEDGTIDWGFMPPDVKKFFFNLTAGQLQQHNQLNEHGDQLATEHKRNNQQDAKLHRHEKRLGDHDEAIASRNQRASSIELAAWSQSQQTGALLGEIMQPGLVSMRAHGRKSDGYQVELEPDYASFSVGGDHEHPDVLYRPGGNVAFTVGIPELSIYINNSLQKWRHIDPSLVYSVAGKLGATEQYEAPDVPDFVLNAGNADAQVAVMRKLVKAYTHNDSSISAFREYIDSFLLYAESWNQKTYAGDPSPSFRHTEDSRSIEEQVHEESVYGGMGMKGVFENKSRPVTAIHDGQMITTMGRMIAKRLGTIANPDYDPERALYLNYDPAVAARTGLDAASIIDTRYAHFAVRQRTGTDAPRYGHVNSETLLNDWMQTIWGLSPGENIPLRLSERRIDVYSVGEPDNKNQPLNAAKYTNWGAIPDDAVGRNVFRFGWTQPHEYVALTSHDEVMGYRDPYNGMTYRYSKAIPWQVVIIGCWQNPTWNPYGVPYVADKSTITGDGNSPETAYSGWNEDHYGYVIPLGIFDEAAVAADSADTGAGYKWMMCADGAPRKHVAAGVRIFSLAVDGKRQRMRYPIMPISHHGHPVYQWMRSDRRRNDATLFKLTAGQLSQHNELNALREQLINQTN